MMNQKRWVEIINPDVSYLKLRYLWKENGVDPKNYGSYLTGKVLMQAFPGPVSTEMRLLSYNKNKNLEHSEVEYSCFTHNLITRVQNYEYPENYPADLHNNCKCYDCTFQAWVLNDHFEIKGIERTRENYIEKIKMFDKFLSYSIKEVMPIISVGSWRNSWGYKRPVKK
jgi:hypothetical protein